MATSVIFAALACFAVLTLACDLENTRQGCKINGGVCMCGYGCKTEYAYTTRRQCMDALRERGNNICLRMPCINGGSCIQITPEPGFKCRCEGTGYYGLKCDRACSNNLLRGGNSPVPYECIIF